MAEVEACHRQEDDRDTEALLSWRDPRRGKHHLSCDGWVTLCGRPVPGYWETEGSPKWADEDCCKSCLARQPAAGAQQRGSPDQTAG